jgi:hypothetical protein
MTVMAEEEFDPFEDVNIFSVVAPFASDNN